MATGTIGSKAASPFDAIELSDKLTFYLIDHGVQILSAFAIMAAGFMIARWVGKFMERWLSTKHLDQPMRLLAVRIVKLLIIGFMAIMALGQMGFQITPLIAGIGVAGVGISLAMQGLLGNLIAGLTIIFTKPFAIDEYIELLGVQGQVSDISLFSTKLLHTDNSIVVVPNRKIVGEILHNYGKIRQLEHSVGVAYDTDLDLALKTIGDLLNSDPRVLKDPSPVFGAASLGASAIIISIKPWVNVPDFVSVQYDINKAIIEKFREKNINIPLPRQEIHLLNETRKQV